MEHAVQSIQDTNSTLLLTLQRQQCSYIESSQYTVFIITDLVLLSNAVCSCLCLQVVLWVPVTVKDDDGVCSGEVDTETTSTS